ncbi:uncharacterized protein METZ01_LOCUS141060, partial [marine metagenome]
FAFYLARFAATETRTGGYYTMDIKARNVAMTGLEHGIQSYKTSRSISTINGSFNTGNYLVEFDASNNESGSPLPHSNYIMMKSRANIDDVERNLRLFISSMPESFCFSYYGNNAGNQTFTEPNDFINGDMFYNGNVQANSGTNSGTTYTSTGVGGTLLSSPPPFPQLDITLYENLLTAAAAEDPPSTYDNYALDFNSSDYVGIGSSSDINSGIHSQRTIEAWFRTNNKDSSTRQVIYEEGGGTRGLNIYIHSGRLYVGGWNRPSNESNWNPGTWIYTTSIQNNQWHHVALTLNGGSSVSANVLKMYLDGNYTTGGNGSQIWGHNPANIGCTRSGSRYHNGTGNGYTFNGKIDEVRIWNVERTAGQIAAKKDTILVGNESGLTAYYNFQENTGNTVNDTQTQSNNDGTISGASWTDGPPFSKMIQSSYTNTTINLSSFTNNQKLHNGNLTLTGTTVNGPGYLVVDGNLTIESSSAIKKNVFLICSGNLTITSSTAGTGIRTPAIVYAKGTISLSSSTVYGLIIAKGSSCTLNQTAVNGGILNYGATFSLSNTSSVTGSAVSNYSIDLTDANSSISKGNLPPFFGLNVGLDPMIIPGSYLEY